LGTLQPKLEWVKHVPLEQKGERGGKGGGSGQSITGGKNQVGGPSFQKLGGVWTNKRTVFRKGVRKEGRGKKGGVLRIVQGGKKEKEERSFQQNAGG